jgi:hypothetical protein
MENEKAENLPAEKNQLDIFSLLDKDDMNYSSTVELYDAIPLYVFQRTLKQQSFIEKEFTHKKKRYQVKLEPAFLNKDGIQKTKYPGAREELVEQVLRKLACEGQAIVRGNLVGVVFSLYQVYNDLKVMGHTFSYEEIKDAIYVCRKTGIELTSLSTDNKKTISVENIFVRMGIVSEDAEDETSDHISYEGKKELVFIIFHPLVTESILVEKTFRQINYTKYMGLKKYLARWLFKKMNHNYIQAEYQSGNDYHLSLDEIVEGSGITRYKAISNTIREVEKALNELVEKDILEKFEIDKKKFKRSKKIIDAVFHLYPSWSFAKDMKRANAKAKQIRGEGGRDRIKKILNYG